jgi:hypothetical protein
MGRKPTGQTTTVIRIPIKHKEKIQQYIQHLKQAETTPQTEPPEPAETPQTEQPEPAETPVTLGLIEQWGIVDLQQTAKLYGINYFDEHGRMLPKEELREKMMRFFMGYVTRNK